MSRNFERNPTRMMVEYRSASALLVAYSVNLGRGGMFIECKDAMPEVGSTVELCLCLPPKAGQTGTAHRISISAMVAWCRHTAEDAGPPGVGLSFHDDELGASIDDMVRSYSGIRIVVQCVDNEDRQTLHRRITAIIGTAEVIFSAHSAGTQLLLDESTDLVIVNADEDAEGAARTLQAASSLHEIPTIALCHDQLLWPKLKAFGADEVLFNPPSRSLLRSAVLGRIARPRRVQTEA